MKMLAIHEALRLQEIVEEWRRGVRTSKWGIPRIGAFHVAWYWYRQAHQHEDTSIWQDLAQNKKLISILTRKMNLHWSNIPLLYLLQLEAQSSSDRMATNSSKVFAWQGLQAARVAFATIAKIMSWRLLDLQEAEADDLCWRAKPSSVACQVILVGKKQQNQQLSENKGNGVKAWLQKKLNVPDIIKKSQTKLQDLLRYFGWKQQLRGVKNQVTEDSWPLKFPPILVFPSDPSISLSTESSPSSEIIWAGAHIWWA